MDPKEKALELAIETLIDFSWEGSSVNYKARQTLVDMLGCGNEVEGIISRVRAKLSAAGVERRQSVVRLFKLKP